MILQLTYLNIPKVQTRSTCPNTIANPNTIREGASRTSPCYSSVLEL